MLPVYVLLVVFALFAFVVVFGAPYLPTHNRQVELAFELAKLKPGQHITDLGCGDGKVLVYAAKRGVYATGYEINPLLWLVSVIRTWPYRKLVTVKLKSFWAQRLPKTDVIFVFLIEHFMNKLDKKLGKELKPGTKVISHAFRLPRQELASREALFLYKY